ncbi:MAG: SDR family NAD(P)-dependent oxidoreductase [Clostridia bacterium]|nr:SDR family NAD(P)-dependent oxidoreductase [Clostridia bacterium]
MSIKNWLSKNTSSLNGKTVAVTGSTGGLGKELCRHLAALGAELILMNRSEGRTESQIAELKSEFSDVRARFIPLDLEDIRSVRAAVERLKADLPDVIIHNAGAYSIPRHTCEGGLDNVFQINFASPYYMTRELLPSLAQRGGRVVFVGSIAHNYSKIDESDLDFSTRGRASLVYGNAKRHLMYSAFALSKEYDGAVSVTHPGITFTNITAHYPKVIFALIKHPMKVIFTRPKKASLSILKGVFEPTRGCEWIGPRGFNVWGYPNKKRLDTASEEERAIIVRRAEKVYELMKNI